MLAFASTDPDIWELDGKISISAQEYEALTGLESQVRRMAAKRTPISRGHLSDLLERIRWARSMA